MEGNNVFGIAGFCEQGLYFSANRWNTAIALMSIIILGITLYWVSKSRAKIVHKKRSYWFLILTTLMSMGTVLAADLFTFFICFQLLTLTSYVLIVHEEKKKAMRAGSGYLVYGLLTGMVMLMGMFLLSHEAGTTNFEELAVVCKTIENKEMLYLAGILFLVGLGMNMGLFPLHTWQPKVYESVTVPVAGFMVSIVNKSGLFGLVLLTQAVFPDDVFWSELIMTLGLLTLIIAGVRSLFTGSFQVVLNFISMIAMGSLCILLSKGIGEQIALVMLLHMMGSLLLFAALYLAMKNGIMIEIDLNQGIKGKKYASKNSDVIKNKPVMGISLIIGFALLYRITITPFELVQGISRSIKLIIGIFNIVTLIGFVRAVYMMSGKAQENYYLHGTKSMAMMCRENWPQWLCLEKLIYEPVVMHLLPFISALVLRICDRLVDSIVKLLRKTVFRDRKERIWDKVGTPTTYICGIILDEFVLFLNKTFFRRKPIEVSFVNLLADYKMNLNLTTNLVTRSVSFGLLMFCLGFCATLAYLFFF